MPLVRDRRGILRSLLGAVPMRGRVVTWSQAGRWAAVVAGIVALAFLTVWVFPRRQRGDERLVHVHPHDDERDHARGALLHRRERLHAHLRPHARRQHGARDVLPARRLHRADPAAGLGRQGSTIGLQSSDVDRFWIEWVLPLLIGGVVVGFIGLGMQQTLLRWNQGQELRQALITIAFSIIVADLMLEHWGGVAKDIAIPLKLDRFVEPARRGRPVLRLPPLHPLLRGRGRARCSGSG